MTTPQPLRIAVSGYAGTGKTSLSEALASRLDLQFVADDTVAIIDAGRALTRAKAEHNATEMTRSANGMVHAIGQWATRREQAIGGNERYVADQWSADILASWLLAMGSGARGADEVTSRLIKDMQEQAAQFDYIVMLPAQSPFTKPGTVNGEDKAQPPSMSHQLLVQSLTYGLMRLLTSFRGLHIPGGDLTVEQRADYVETCIRTDREERAQGLAETAS